MDRACVAVLLVSADFLTSKFILGEEVEALEREIAAYCGARFAVACASGSDALYLALRAADIAPGDEVDVEQELARRLHPHGVYVSRSPVRGRVKEVNEEFGLVLVEPLREELSVAAWLPAPI